MTDYKNTLNLPKTKFSMRANLAQREPMWLKQWQQDNVYQQMLDAKRDGPNFVLHDGPPYANGNIHLGHALNKTIKDIIVKSKALSGYYTPYIPGWDCHGLPIELKVEKSLGEKADKSEPFKFQRACRKFAAKQVKLQKQDFERLGIFGDWQHPYCTSDFEVEAETVRVLAKLLADGYIVRGEKPVNWCTQCGSSLAEAEVEYQDITSTAVYVAFNVVLPSAASDEENPANDSDLAAILTSPTPVSVLIWTTTVWTLPANQAVCVHPDIDYTLVEVDQTTGDETHNKRFLIAEALVDDVMAKAGHEHYTRLSTIKGAALEHLALQHPFYNRDVPIVLGDHVTTESGTGLVHTAPSHGQDDYLIGQTYKLPMTQLVGGDGSFTAQAELVANQTIAEATKTLLAQLETNGALFYQERYPHSYPHCWRHKTPIIFRSTPQWFLTLEAKQLRERILAETAAVDWTPEWGEARLSIMTKNRPDWCISRQRTWGIPMCLIVHKEHQTLHPDMPALMQQFAERIEQRGIESWWQVDLAEFIGDDAEQYVKLFDTLDVWFESGCTRMSVVNKREAFRGAAPDLYMEGADQYRGWLMSSMVLACAIYDKAPYRQVLSHGFTVDANGHKMSKSLGNGIEPNDIIKQYGADILRLWVASTEYTKEISLSDQILQSSADSYRRLRNTARYLLSNLHDFDPTTDCVPPSNCSGSTNGPASHA